MLCYFYYFFDTILFFFYLFILLGSLFSSIVSIYKVFRDFLSPSSSSTFRSFSQCLVSYTQKGERNKTGGPSSQCPNCRRQCIFVWSTSSLCRKDRTWDFLKRGNGEVVLLYHLLQEFIVGISFYCSLK